MAVCGGLSLWRFYANREVFFLLLSFKNFLFSYYLTTRTDSEMKAPWGQRIFSYFSTVLPLAYQGKGGEIGPLLKISIDFLFIGGLSLSTLAVIDLNRNIGVAPAKRRYCTSGVYRYLSHPMYLGYVVAEIGWILVNPVNLTIFGISTISYFIRGKIEARSFSAKPKLQPSEIVF